MGPTQRRYEVTVDQIIAHLSGEEMIHMGEVLVMMRQQDIDLPSYFLLSVMEDAAHPWETLARQI